MILRRPALLKSSVYVLLIGLSFVVSYFLSHRQKEILHTEFKVSQREICKLISKNITDEFDGLVISLESLASDLETSPIFSWDLRELVSDYNQSKNAPLPAGEWYREMALLYSQHKKITDGLYVLRSDGIVLARYPWKEATVGADFSQQNGFRETIDGKKPFIAERTVTRTNNVPSLAVFYPKVKDGKVQYVTRAVIHMHDFSRHFLQNLRDYDFAIINSHNLIIAHTDATRLNQTVSDMTSICGKRPCDPRYCLEAPIAFYSSKFKLHMCPDSTNLDAAVQDYKLYTFVLCLLIALTTIAGLELYGKHAQLGREFQAKQRLEEESRQLANKWQKTFDAVDDLIFITNRSHKVEMANKATVLRLKRSPIGESCFQSFHNANEPIPGCLIHESINHGTLNNFEAQFPMFDNHWFDVSGYPVVDNEGQVTHLIHVLRDVTEKRQNKIELENALEKAKTADRCKSEFLANMSHEIRTPLNIIIGFSEILIDHGKLDAANLKYVSNIIAAAKQLLYIINEIIDLSKIEAGQLRVDITVEDLHMLLDSIQELMCATWQDKSPVKLILELPSENKTLLFKSDYNRLSQIIMNLINNAFKFTPQGEIRFGYFIEETHLHFYVKDTGIGIPLEQQQSIFERFTQIDSEQGKKHTGAGLGLAISKKLIGLLWQSLTGECREELWVESKEGAGSTFHFTHPLLSAAPKIKSKVATQSVQSVTGAKILVVEDNDENYEMMHTILEKMGMEPQRAADGRSAVDLLQTNHDLRLVITDIRLPDLDGCDLVRRIRQYENDHAHPRLPVIAVTANAMPENRDRCLEAGCDHFLAKPLDTREFSELVMRCLRGE